MSYVIKIKMCVELDGRCYSIRSDHHGSHYNRRVTQKGRDVWILTTRDESVKLDEIVKRIHDVLKT